MNHERKIPSISVYAHNESNVSLKEALSYLENHPSIVNNKRKGLDTRILLLEKLIPIKLSKLQ